MDRSRIVVRRPDVLEAEVDGERVVMSGKTYTYFGLADTGLIIWERLDGSRSLGEVVASLTEEFAADEDQIWADVIEFVEALEAADLIEP